MPKILNMLISSPKKFDNDFHSVNQSTEAADGMLVIASKANL